MIDISLSRRKAKDLHYPVKAACAAVAVVAAMVVAAVAVFSVMGYRPIELPSADVYKRRAYARHLEIWIRDCRRNKHIAYSDEFPCGLANCSDCSTVFRK